MKVRSTSLSKDVQSETIKALITGGLFCCPNTCQSSHTSITRPLFGPNFPTHLRANLATSHPPNLWSKLSTLAAALATPPKNSRRSCGVRTWLETLTPADQAAAEDAFENIQWRTTALTDVFKAQGFPGQINIVTKHRLGNCSCL